MPIPTPVHESYANRIFATLRGTVTLSVITVNTIFWAIPIYVGVLLKLLVPSPGWRARVQRQLIPLAEAWISCNNAILRLFRTTTWRIRGLEGLRRDGRYLVNANHQSWADVLVLQRTFNRVVPFLKFFIKQELIWVPVLGLAWWGLEFPFMKRYSSEFLERHPELRGKDLETTAAMCRRLGDQPISIMNFLEGTRFTEEKRELQNAPYRYLLRPKAGGIAFVLGAIGGTLSSMLDVTIVYEGNGHSLWDFVCGRVRSVTVDVRERPLPRELVARDYHEDEDFRDRVQAWVRDLWTEKDSLIGAMTEEIKHAESPSVAPR
jgi:1-acyl-sn-glycerol-3-phosphate acyltransferase